MSDISSFTPVSVPQETNAALNIQVIPQYDTIALELDDRINLRFIPSNPAITPETYFAGTGEFLRDVTSVRILDNDSEHCVYLAIINPSHEGYSTCLCLCMSVCLSVFLSVPTLAATLFIFTLKVRYVGGYYNSSWILIRGFSIKPSLQKL